jgi:DNA-binding FadR family transcriptional regulator
MSTLYFHVARATYRDLVEARLVIEPMMANVLASREDDEARLALEEALESTHSAVTEDDSRRYLSATTEFHTAIMSVSGNPILDVYGESLRAIFAERVSGTLFPLEYRSKIAEQHQQIADAILGSKPALAEELMRSHMQDYVRQANERFPGILDEVVDWK